MFVCVVHKMFKSMKLEFDFFSFHSLLLISVHCIKNKIQAVEFFFRMFDEQRDRECFFLILIWQLNFSIKIY